MADGVERDRGAGVVVRVDLPDAVSSAPAVVDVLVMGGGLAGLTCALHLRQAHPQLAIRVLERREGPAPEATHKVGESTVEIGAHYFGEVLGLRDHLRDAHVRKFGFRFFSSDGRPALDAVQEIGVGRFLSAPSYQIDRGIFENHLAERCRAAGIDLQTGAVVDGVDLSPSADGDAEPSVVRYVQGGEDRVVRTRWVVDASGRAGRLKRQLGLAEDNGHDANAVWFRTPFRIDVEAWSTDPAWLGRCVAGQRWRSTNHLVGDGYWVWLIPLASGYHSVGIVADAATHPLATMNTFERALEWLQRHQPRLAEALLDAGVGPADFAAFRNFSYGCREVFSARRWAITGEAGFFLDPFYSPGSDFIAITNTYIVELVSRDLRGQALAPAVRAYSRLLRSFYESTLTLYEGQYGIFGHPEALACKVMWDYTYYWGILCPIFFQNRLTDLSMFGRIGAVLMKARALNEAMQALLRVWAAAGGSRNPARILDQARLPWFVELNEGLAGQLDDDERFVARMSESLDRLEALAAEIVGRAQTSHPLASTWPEAGAALRCAGREAAPQGAFLSYPEAVPAAA